MASHDQGGMSMTRLIGANIYLRLENNTDFVELEDADGRIFVSVTGVDPTLGLWVLNRKYPVRESNEMENRAAHVLVPFRSILSIALLDKSLEVDEVAMASSLEEAMSSGAASKEDLERMAKDKVNCSRQSFRNAKLAGANLTGIVMRETDLERSDLRRAKLINGDFKDANLREVNAEGADFTGAYLWEAIMEGAVFKDASFKNANLYLANLKAASLAGCNFENANLVETTLTDAKLNGANLEGVKLLRARIDKVQGTDREWKALGAALKKEGKEYFQTSYLSEARWCLEKSMRFFQQAKDSISAGEVKSLMDDLEEEEKLAMAIQKERPDR